MCGSSRTITLTAQLTRKYLNEPDLITHLQIDVTYACGRNTISYVNQRWLVKTNETNRYHDVDIIRNFFLKTDKKHYDLNI